MSCLILDTCSVGTLLHRQCHCTSRVVGSLQWQNNFYSGWCAANDNCTITTFCDSPKMIVLILDICRIGTLLHLLCHITSYVFGLIPWGNNFDSGWFIATDNCNAIPSVVVPTILIEWWELASSIVTAIYPFGTFPRISCLILDN